MDNKPAIGLSLSGGGARGIAHLGVIKALLENGIEPDFIAGTSAGAIVGALYAAGHDPDSMLEFVEDASIWRVFKVSMPVNGLARLTYLRERLAQFIPEDRFEALRHPLFITATNLVAGTSEVFDRGPLFDVIVASCSIPLVFKPVQLNGAYYVDGGLLENMPVRPLEKAGAEIIIGVNVMPAIPVDPKSVQSVFGVATRIFDLSVQGNTRPNAERCHFFLDLKGVYPYHIFQFSKYRELYEIGYRSTVEQMGVLKAVVGKL